MSKVPKPELTNEQKKKANLLCVFSLIFGILLPLVFGGLSFVLDNCGMDTLSAYALFPAVGGFLAGMVLMIIVRAKYPRSVFGVILMILYIILIALVVIGTVILILAFLTACTDPTW